MRKRELLDSILALKRECSELRERILALELVTNSTPLRTCHICRNERSVHHMHENRDGRWYCNSGNHLPSKESFEVAKKPPAPRFEDSPEWDGIMIDRPDDDWQVPSSG